MTRQQIASSAWDAMHERLALKGIITRDLPPDVRDDLVAAIEQGMGEAAPSPAPAHREARRGDDKDEARLCLVDTTKLNLNKPVDGRITVDSSAFSVTDGHVVIQRGEELIVRERQGQVFIAKRQA